jgi:DNA-binding XRE family transcriptional regulator
MDEESTLLGRRAAEVARAFGLLTRSRRKALNMTQDQLALATGVGRRFLIDLEAGKTTCQLGLSLVVAQALGLRPADMLKGEESPPLADALELPSPLDEELEHAGAIDG